VERELFALDAARLLTPHVLLPVQVEQPVDRWLHALCLAIFEDALKCLDGRQRDREKAWEWIQSDTDAGLSFRNVCWVLRFDPEAVRRQLLQGGAPQRQVARVVRFRKSAYRPR
jgi:hypothetical protein